MSLKLKKTDTFKTRIDVTLPDGSTGHFSGEFRYYDRDGLDALMAEGLTDPAFVERTLVGQQGIEGEDGSALSFPDALTAVQANLALTAATVRGFWQAIGGAPAKNSPTSRAR